jgi:hypothetical protein
MERRATVRNVAVSNVAPARGIELAAWAMALLLPSEGGAHLSEA